MNQYNTYNKMNCNLVQSQMLDYTMHMLDKEASSNMHAHINECVKCNELALKLKLVLAKISIEKEVEISLFAKQQLMDSLPTTKSIKLNYKGYKLKNVLLYAAFLTGLIVGYVLYLNSFSSEEYLFYDYYSETIEYQFLNN